MNLYKPCSTMTIQLIDYIQSNPNTIHHMDQFLARYQNGIFNFVRLTVGDYHASMDITNRVLLTLSRKVKEVEKKKAFNCLALLVIKGEISNYWKSQKRQKMKFLRQATIIHNDKEISLLETLESDQGQAEEIFNLLVIRDIIENSGDANCKQVFLRKYRDGQSLEKIAKEMQLTDYQVKKHLHNIQNQVKKYLQEK